MMRSQPSRISRYEIKCPIGGGGMGTLYLARDTNPTTERLVALKLLRANLDSGDLRARFAREAQSLARLNHPNIVNIYDSGEYRGAPFIVMEYVRGETLAEKVRRRAPLSLAQKLKWLAELCSGLAHAHEAGVIHRDIKPANLMVDQHGHLKVVDFGIARVAESLTRVGVQMTQLNVQVGTPGYMSPEQILGGDIDPRSDLFAVGAVAYELLTGREAFPGENTRQIERRVMHDSPAPLHTLVPECTPALAAIVERALAKDANDRFQDAHAMEEAFEEQRARLGPAHTPVPRRPTPSPSARPRGSRADVAYRMALAALEDGAPEAARRHVLEALAEEPAHDDAAALLARLDGRQPLLEADAVPLSSSPIDDRTQVSPKLGVEHGASRRERRDPAGRGSAPTDPLAHLGRRTPPPADLHDLVGGDAPTSHRRSSGFDDSSTDDADPTMVARRPTAARPTGRSRTPRPPAPPARALPVVWRRAALLVAAAAAVLAIVVTAGWFLWNARWDAGFALTVTPEEGGTLIANGITCGSQGTECSAAFAEGTLVELEARADDGYTFTGFTGDCAPSGRTMMDAPRQCGASFARSTTGAAAADVLLTIAPPIGGTIVGQGILCGSQGKECSAKFAAGFVVELQGHADSGYTFQGFSGDCNAEGKAAMSGPRTCGATFVGSAPGKLAAGGPLAAGGARPANTGGASRPPDAPAGAASTPGGGAAAAAGGGAGAMSAGGGAGGGGTSAAGGAGSGPATGGTVSVADPGSAEDAGKPVRPLTTREEASRKLIDETLQRYLAAYGRLDYQDLLTVFPTAPRTIRGQLSQYAELEYTFGGPPKYLKFDPDAGSALVELEFKQVFKPKVGGAQPPNEGRVTFQMHRLSNDDWVIDSAQFRAKK